MPAVNALLRARTTKRHRAITGVMQQSRQGGGQLIREGPGKADSSAGRRACGEATPDEAQVAPEKRGLLLPPPGSSNHRRSTEWVSLTAESRYCIVQH